MTVEIWASVTLEKWAPIHDGEVITLGDWALIRRLHASEKLPKAVIARELLADGVRVLVSIPEEAAPQRFEFEFAGDAATLERGDDGTISVLDAGGHLLGDIAAPWAVDANGVSVPTEYVIDGSKIVQLVHHQGGGYTYPVTADPSIFFYIKCAGQIALFIAENGGPGKILKGGVAGAKTLVKILKSKGSKKDALKYLAYELSGAKGLADLVDKCFPS